MFRTKLLTRSTLLVIPIALAVAGCQTAPSNSGAAQSAKQDAMKNQTSIAALRDEIMKSSEASERAANAAERAAEQAKAAADKADRIFQRLMRK